MTGHFIEIILACKAFASVIAVIALVIMVVIEVISLFRHH